MKVLIAGGGIAGPATAIALHKAGIAAAVYEAYPEDAADAGAFMSSAGPVSVTSAYDIPSLPAWHNDAMTVIGDAAHAASPSTAQGGTGNPPAPAPPSAPRRPNPTEWLFGHHIDWRATVTATSSGDADNP